MTKERSVISRDEALAGKVKHYFTGRPCKRGHVALRYVATHQCLDCLAMTRAERVSKSYWKDPERSRAKAREWAKNNPDNIRRNKQRAWAKYRIKGLAKNREWQRKNRERHAVFVRRWQQQNEDKFKAILRARRARQLQAMPPWVRPEELATIYAEARRLTRETGSPHEVDHIIPLQGKDVCGLHVPWNLRVITREENRVKSNKVIKWKQASAF